MNRDIYSNEDLLACKKFILNINGPLELNLNLLSNDVFCWDNFDITEVIEILKIAKDKNVTINLTGKLQEADLARLLPYLGHRASVQEKYNLFVRDYIIEAYVGIYNHEYNKKQKLRLNLNVEAVKDRNLIDITNCFSYDIILDAIAYLTKNKHIELLEVFAAEICDIILSHPLVLSVKISVEKLELVNAGVGIELFRTR